MRRGLGRGAATHIIAAHKVASRAQQTRRAGPEGAGAVPATSASCRGGPRHFLMLAKRFLARYTGAMTTDYDEIVVPYAGSSGQQATRPALLVHPAGHQPLVVIHDGRTYGGLTASNAQRRITDAVHRDFPDHTAVFHDRDGRPAADGDLRLAGEHCEVVWFDNGRPVFGDGLPVHPQVEASLAAAGLLR